ncbi:MAG: sugar phosphate isomerase/epimerase [Treponema sp.]|jgi:sugar phosphate isomerase/epimerase|nr:sugar phosphate isomerase/epimerase [Treponema sp.]
MITNHDIKLGVSLYSYQDNYYFKKHDLEGCIAAAAGAGAEGIEVFPEMMMPEWPYISDAFVDKWNGWMRRYAMKPVCIDHFADRAMWKNKQLTDDELVERSVWYIKAASKLGAKFIRLMHSAHMGHLIPGPGGKTIELVNPKIAARLLPYCAEYNVVMALECHAPSRVDDPLQEPYLEEAEKLGLSQYIGLQADFSSYEYRPSTAVVERSIRDGGKREVLYYLLDLIQKLNLENIDYDAGQVEEKIKKMGAGEEEMGFFDRYVRRQTRMASYEKLKEYAKRLVYVHGKFHYIGEDGEVDCIDYQKTIGALKEGGYRGFICSEFEGNRLLNDIGWVDEIEYVRKHHVLMRKCLGYQD